MKVYGCANSRSLRAIWALEEVGASYDYVAVDLGAGAGRDAEYLAVNPCGKVPVLVVDDLILTESAAICLWLGACYPAANLVPESGSRAHADVLRWVMFVVTEFEQPLWTIAKHRFALPESQRVTDVIDTARWEFEIVAGLFEDGLGDREYIAGDAFSVADMLAAHTIAWASKAASKLVTPALTQYMQRMMSRPALARARAREAA